MDKAEMVDEMMIFKKMSVLPTEKDFLDAIVSVSLQELKRNRIHTILKAKACPKFDLVHRTYKQTVKCVSTTFIAMLQKVSKEFRALNQTHPSVYGHLRDQGFDISHFSFALEQLVSATRLINSISMRYVKLMNKDDCDSLDKCKRLKVDALGCFLTVAMRIIPCLAYLENIRQHMAQATDKNLEDENAATLTNKKHVALLSEEDCTEIFLSPRFDIQNVAGFVLPETLRWLGDLELEYGFKLQDNQLDSAKLSQTHKEHLVHYSRL